MSGKKPGAALGAAAVSVLLLVGLASAAITIETVPVGNVGNTANATGQGRVDYGYNIGKYEVTAGQYAAFLNAVAGVDTYGLYFAEMSRTDHGCGITQSGGGIAANPYTYFVATEFVNRPVNYVSFWDACRFTNWLNNGQKAGAQDASTTETGAYSLNGAMYPINGNITRDTGAQWAVVSQDEWYKAAYYKGGGTNADYWVYPTRSDTAPGRDMADVSGNNANFWGSAPYPIDSGTYTTVVGRFKNSVGPYGTFDQGGNVSEWTEAMAMMSGFAWGRTLKGGSCFKDVYMLEASAWTQINAERMEGDIGFRVVQVPEPASIGIFGLGFIGMLMRRRGAAR